MQTPAHDPWRCSVCGSLSVECRTWSDVNTGESAAGDDGIEYLCLDCENNNVIHESEYLQRVEEWWNGMDENEQEKLVYVHFGKIDQTTEGPLSRFWQTCSNKQKIDIWRKIIYPDCDAND